MSSMLLNSRERGGRVGPRALGALLAFAGTACGGLTGARSTNGADASTSIAPDAGGNAAMRDAPTAIDTSVPTDALEATDAAPDASSLDAMAGPDPGRVSIHRLSRAEYANTIRDLLGVPAAPDMTGFPMDPTIEGFDNNANALTVTPDAYAWYFHAAQIVADETFADPALSGRILTCTPTAAFDAACAQTVIRAFGLRAWRRPLTDDEVNGLVQLASAQSPFAAAIEQVVVAMLCAESFLYRIEYDADPNSTALHPLSPYELASRLSYFLWSTMPDDTLFMHAAAGDLTQPDVVAEELTRMLADPRSDELVHNFAGQWLGFARLESHSISTSVFSDAGSPALLDAMEQEAFLYFALFRDPTLKLTDLLSSNVNFVNGSLAQLYGIAAIDGGDDSFNRVDNATSVRKGYLGLAAFLTATSWPDRSSPSIRGQWVMNQLLCQSVADDPMPAPELGYSALPARQLLMAADGTPACSMCHEQIDPLGFGLEAFDAIGAFRNAYPSGDAVDTSGVIFNGIPFNGLTGLADELSHDPRVVDCMARKALVYALGRSLVAADDPYVAQLRDTWDAGGQSLPALLGAITQNGSFLMRHGEAP